MMKGQLPYLRFLAFLLALTPFGWTAGIATAQVKAHSTAHPVRKQGGQPQASADPFWTHSYREAFDKAAPVGGMFFVRLVQPQKGPAKSMDPLDKKVLDSLKQYCAAGVILATADTSWERLLSQPKGGAGVEKADLSSSRQAGSGSFAFVNGKGVLLYAFLANPADSVRPPGDEIYLAGLRQALDRKTGMQQLTLFEAERMLGDKDAGKLEAIIRERSREGLPVDSLLEVYVHELPADSAASPRVLKFLAMQAPVLNSLANQLLRQDADRFMGVWKSLSIKDRVRINNEVIEKTWRKAVRDTSEDVATLAATYAANTNLGNTAKVRAYQGIMLEYFYGIGDTLRFLNLAGSYYDRFLMHMDPDSLRREDSVHHRDEDMSVARFVGEQLEKGARRVGSMTNTRNLLQQAAEWADMAAALYPSPAALETRDRLFSRLRPGKP